MKHVHQAIAAAATLALTMGFAACGSTNGAAHTDEGTGTADKPVKITVWAYGVGQKEIVAAFEKSHPTIKVNLQNVGNAGDTAQALSNAIKAGSGAPDVVELEDPVITQFAIQNQVEDLSRFGADKFADDYSQGPWSKVQFNGKPYGLPMDSAPEMLFYNKEVFDEAGIQQPPRTWDEYYEDAKLIRALGGDHYIANDAGDNFQPFIAHAWQAGAKPFTVNGETIHVNFTDDANLQRYITFRQKLLDEHLINTKIGNWSDDWYRSLSDGTTASLTIGGWMAANLESNAPKASGKWRIAQIPQWKAGGDAGSEDGGSGMAIVAGSRHAKAAWEFITFHSHGEGSRILASKGKAPALKSVLTGKDFLDEQNPYFGGQKVNEELSKAADLKISTFQFPPFTAYAQTLYGDVIGKAYQDPSVRLKDAFKDYQDQLSEYAKSQGFDVK